MYKGERTVLVVAIVPAQSLARALNAPNRLRKCVHPPSLNKRHFAARVPGDVRASNRTNVAEDPLTRPANLEDV